MIPWGHVILVGGVVLDNQRTLYGYPRGLYSLPDQYLLLKLVSVNQNIQLLQMPTRNWSGMLILASINYHVNIDTGIRDKFHTDTRGILVKAWTQTSVKWPCLQLQHFLCYIFNSKNASPISIWMYLRSTVLLHEPNQTFGRLIIISM